MDPLSITASVAGLIAITAQLSSTIKSIIGQAKDAPDMLEHIKIEVDSINLALQQLRELIYRKCFASRSKPTLITLENLLAVLASSMWTFSKLERVVFKFKSNGKMSLQQRILWVIKADSVGSLLERVQHHKSSLLLMLSIAQSHSQIEADQAADKLQRCVEQLLADNDVLKQRLSLVNTEQSSKWGIDRYAPSSATGIEQGNESQLSEKQVSFDPGYCTFSFESELLTSSVYCRSSHLPGAWSISRHSLTTGKHCHSVLSGVSLSNVSNLATFPVPVYPSEIANATSYSFAKESRKEETQSLRANYERDISATELYGKPLDIVCKQAGVNVFFRDFRSGRYCKRRVPIVLATISDFILSQNVTAGALQKLSIRDPVKEVPLERQYKVSRLVKLFNTPPYAVDLEHECASIEDAIYCLIHFLSNLPQPMIPDTCENLIGFPFGGTDDFHRAVYEEKIRRIPIYGEVPMEPRSKIQCILFRLSLESQDAMEFIHYLIYQLAERNILSGNIHDVASIFTPFMLPVSFLSHTEEHERDRLGTLSSKCLTCVCVMMALRLRNEIRIKDTDAEHDSSAATHYLQPAYVGVQDSGAAYQLNTLDVTKQKQGTRNTKRLSRWFSVSQQPEGGRPILGQNSPGRKPNFATTEAVQASENKFKKYNSEPKTYRTVSHSSRPGQLRMKPRFLEKLGL